MKESPRSKALVRLSLVSTLLVALAPVAVYGQGSRSRSTPQRPKPAAESKEARDQRRGQALDLLRETAERARSFDDLFDRARIQTLAADALWNSDAQQARLIFRRAWEAATASDKAAVEEIERQSGAEAAQDFVMDARYELLLKAAARDAVLGEAFLKEFEKERQERDAPQSQATALTPRGQLSMEEARRLGFADELLARGESNSAAQMAAPLVSRGVRPDIVAFIIRLRERNAAASDRLYTQLLAQARADRSADANSVLLLSSPVISPELLVTVGEGGSLQFRPVPRGASETATQPTPINAALRSAFYQTAADILLRPLASADIYGLTQQTVALYLAMGRLLPFFEREAPQYAPELRARTTALGGEMEQGRRDILASHFDLERVTPEQAGDPLRPQSEQLARAMTEAERDRSRLGLVRAAVRNRLWDRARRAAGEIANAESRRAALTFIAVSQIADLRHAYADTKETDYESIVKFLSSADVPALALAWGYAEAAIIAGRSKDARADSLALLTEAERHAGRVDARTRQRVAAYGIVADAAARLEPERAWTILSEVVRAANAVENFGGEETGLDITATESSKEEDADYFIVMNEAFSLDKIFVTMAQLDWTKTLAEARSLEGEVPRALVYIAMARTALDKK